MSAIYGLFVASPFILFLFLLIVRKTRLLTISVAVTLLVSIIAMVAWRVLPIYVFGSLLKGLLVAFDIFLIIFGAILFLEILKRNKIIENISFYLESVSHDVRVQVIILGWFFVNFLEGTAGFGTGATVVAPLLMTLGITPLGAVIISLFGNSASGVFGAAGTPIKIGFGALAGPSVAYYAVLINIVGMLVPVFILWFVVHTKSERVKEFLEALPFAIWSGIAFSVSSVFMLSFGQEFPSIMGSVVGLVLVLITTKLGLFVPKFEKNLVDIPKRPDIGVSAVAFPYALLISLLIIGKFWIGSSGFAVPLTIPHTFSYFNPGFMFIITSIIVSLLYKVNRTDFSNVAGLTFKRSIEPFLVIALMAAFAQIMVNSGKNYSGLPSMVNFAADGFKNVLLPIWAPVLGAFGSFLTGSVTVSNLMFGNFLARAATDLGMSSDKILALAVVGGAAGNMIALGDIITAEAVVGIKNRERSVLKSVIVPCLIYVALVCVVGFLIV